jgi:hypothetical protein
MSAVEILAVIGIIGFIIFKQLKGEALHGKRAVLLPAILTVIGFTDLHAANGQRLQTVDITWIAIGCVGSVLIGLAFGAITRLESRGGYLWAQLPAFGLWLWAAMFAWRVATMVVASGMHARVAASTSTLLFSLGLNRLAQAAVILPRAMAMGVPFAPEKDGTSFLSGLFERDAAQAPVGAGRVGGGNGGNGNGNGNRGHGYNDGPVDLGREFGQRNDQYRQDSRDDGWDRGYDDRDRRYDPRDSRDRHDRRHDRIRARRNGRFGDRW